jgi:hypothetical protein
MMTETERSEQVKAIIAAIKPLAAEYYQLTGKHLGVTGEVGEGVVASLFGMTLAPSSSIP